MQIIDRRREARPSIATWPRPWSKVTGICLHQTACNMGERPERYDTLNVHYVVTRAGKIIQLHDLTTATAHGNGWNNQTVGIEIDGLYAGVEGDSSTVWDDPSTPSKETAQALTCETRESCKALIRHIVSATAIYGGKLGVLVAHRQSSSSRRNDPGSAIWTHIALPISAELGLTDGGIGFKLDTGYPIPESWDPRCKGIKY